MKKIIPILSIVLLVSACGTKENKTEASNSDRMEITRFIVNRVIFQDTLLINRELNDTAKTKLEPHSCYDGNPALYLKGEQFEKLKEAIWMVIKSPDSKTFFNVNGGPPDWSQPAPKDVIRDKIIMCDSITESSFDEKGNEILTAKFYCDSSSIMDAVSQIYFYESWFLNKKTSMIERDVLGYSLYRYDAEKQGFRQLFYVFRDEEAFKTAKKNYTEL